MDFKELFLKRRLKSEETTEEEKKSDKTGWIVLILVGLLLLVIALPTNSSKNNKTEDTVTTNLSAKEKTEDKDSGKNFQETQLEEILSQIEGVGKVKVMISYKDSGTQVVEKDKSVNNGTTTEEDSSGGTRKVTDTQNGESTVYDNDNGDGSPFIAKELTPEIEGILVVAQGGNKISVRQNISNAVLALFPIEAHKIVVVKMND